MRALLGDRTLRENDQASRVSQCRQTVRDRKRGAILDEDLKRILDLLFGLGIERARRLVENENTRIVQKRTGNRHALTLTARKGVTALAHLGIIAVGQLDDEAVRTCHLGGGNDLLTRCRRLRIGDIVVD